MIEQAREAVNALRMLEDCKKNHTACNDCPQYYFGGKIACHPIEYVYGRLADLIESLAAELEQVKQERDGLNILLGQAQSMLETRTRERDVAVQDLNMSCPCEVCARSCQYDKVNPYDECADFMWRGVKEE